MESDSGEAEIKIEYNESFETDPLSENFEVHPLEDIRNVDEQTSDSQDDIVHREAAINESTSKLEGNDQKCNYLDAIDEEGEIQQVNVSWYAAINSSGKYLCRYCDLTYSTIQTLRHHIKTKHPEQAEQLTKMVLNNKRNKKLKCHICKTRFITITELQEHVKENHDLEKIESSCFYCDATFSSKAEMTNHLYLNHEKQLSNIYTCTICGYRTVKKSHFNQHKNTHSRLKYFDCKYCDYKTNYSPNLKIHLRIHMNVKPYRCDYKNCDYRCSAKSALRSHQLKHDPQANMLYCDKCSYKTVYKQSLKKHIDSHRRNCIAIKL